MEDRCIMCGSVIPEGKQVCTNCAIKVLHPDTSRETLEGYNYDDGIIIAEAACLVAIDAMEKLKRLEEWMDDMK